MAKAERPVKNYVEAIRRSGFSIHHVIETGNPSLWIPTAELQHLLESQLRGLSLANLPPRTRSKVFKEKVCSALGYPVPKTFKRTQPRFLGQNFDTYVQQRNNLQVWNEDLSASRRYVVVKLNEQGVVERIKVVSGETLALLDRTGTLTSKYQARCIPGQNATELISLNDTDRLQLELADDTTIDAHASSVDEPVGGQLLSIGKIYERLAKLLGREFEDPGAGQDRARGGELHRIVSEALGYKSFEDSGQFPDVRHQLLEVKLQTAATIDLGLVTPSSFESLDTPWLHDRPIRHCDVRYAIFFGSIEFGIVTLRNLILVTGEDFFSRFPQFGGKVLNKKLQIKLPVSFFD